MQFYFFGEGGNEETAPLDISTLELIAVGYFVVVAAITSLDLEWLFAGITRQRAVVSTTTVQRQWQ